MGRMSYEDITLSGVSRFLVGPQRRVFNVHTALVASQSEALRNLLCNHSFKEAREGQVDFEAVDEKTFVCFCQFAYTNDYDETPFKAQQPLQTPSVELLFKASLSKKSFSQEQQQELGHGQQQRQIEGSHEPANYAGDNGTRRSQLGYPQYPFEMKKGIVKPPPCLGCGRTRDAPEVQKPEPSKNEQQWDAFKNAVYPDPRSRWANQRHEESNLQDYADIFLTNARLYTFAGYHGIRDLEKLAIHKLHRRLVNFDLATNCVDAVVALCRYCFMEDTPAGLRKFVVDYTVCHIKNLWKNEEMQQLVRDSRELAFALVGNMVPIVD